MRFPIWAVAIWMAATGAFADAVPFHLYTMSSQDAQGRVWCVTEGAGATETMWRWCDGTSAPQVTTVDWPGSTAAMRAAGKNTFMSRDGSCTVYMDRERNVALDERQGNIELRCIRCAVAGWTPVDDVGDIDGLVRILLRARQANAGQDFIEKLPRNAHKWFPLSIFIRPRCLAHQHDFRLRVAIGKNHVGRGFADGEPFKPGNRSLKFFERVT